MKLFLILVGMGTAGVLGFMAEPSLRFQFTGLKPKDGAPSLLLEDKLKAPEAPRIDPKTVPQNQLPKEVTLTNEVKINDKGSGMTMTISAGSKVKLIRVTGENAVVRPGETDYTISIPYKDTDLQDQLEANPPSAEPVVEPDPVPTPAGDSEEPKPTPTPDPVAQNTTPPPAPQPAPEPAPVPAADPTPAPVPEPAPAPEPAPVATAKDPVQVMQESLRSGQIKEFTFDQVLDWKAGAEEAVDGENYATGLVSYKAETIFGVKTIQAKALIKEGKVAKWIWPKSGMEIK